MKKLSLWLKQSIIVQYKKTTKRIEEYLSLESGKAYTVHSALDLFCP